MGRHWTSRREIVIDAAIALFVTATALVPLEHGGAVGSGLGALPFQAAGGIVLLARRWIPVRVLIAVAAIGVAALLAGQHTPVIEIPIAIAVYTIARHRPRRLTIGSTMTVAAVLSAVVLATEIGAARSLADVLAPTVLQPAVVVAFAAALGAAVRANRDAVAAANDRARRAEESREAEADRRVAEDRLAIARDLHDSVAHRIAVINLQSAVAASAVRARPDEAEKALAIIGDAARTVISEIQGMLLLLRSGNEANSDEPSLDRLDGLLSVFAGSGLRVGYSLHGTMGDADPQVSAVAYRLVQEGLTNAYKHGDTRTAELTVTCEPSAIRITIRNPIKRTPPRPAGGNGLVGMQERAAGVGGSIRAGMRDDAWQVEALLPLPDRMRVEPLGTVATGTGA